MIASLSPNHTLKPRMLARDIGHQSHDQLTQVDAPVEAICECAEVDAGIVVVLEGVKRPGQRGLAVAQHPVDPVELGQLAPIEFAHDDGLLRALGGRDGSEACQHVTDDDQRGACPAGGPLPCQTQTRHRSELEVVRMHSLVNSHRRYEWRLVLQATPGLAAVDRAAQAGVVGLHRAVLPLSPGRRTRGLRVHQSLSQFAHPGQAFKPQRQRFGLCQADQMDRLQLRVLEQAARRLQGLMATCGALEQIACLLADTVVPSQTAARAAKAFGPACMSSWPRCIAFPCESSPGNLSAKPARI